MLKLIHIRGIRMSIFDKRSKKEEVRQSEEEKLINKTKEGSGVRHFDIVEGSRDFKEEKVLAALQKAIPGSTVTHDGVYIEALNLYIDTREPHVKGAVVQFIFVLKHKVFQEDLMEWVAGVGATFDEAIEEGVKSFVGSTLDAIIQALRNGEGKEVTANLLDKTHTFKLYKSNVVRQGHKISGESIDFWQLLGEDIVRRIGNKRIYLVKVYAARTANTVSCECSVNGMVYPNFTKQLNEVANSWGIDGAIYSERQFFVLIQDEGTYVPYPLAQKEVDSYTLNALLLYRECNSEAAYRDLFDKILEVCPNKSLATELYSFIPEIFTEIIFSDVHYSDEILLIKGEERHNVFRHQLTSYDWIYNVVNRTIRAGYFEKSQVDPIIRCSASLNSINDALSKGSQMEDLSMLGIAVPVPTDYEVL